MSEIKPDRRVRFRAQEQPKKAAPKPAKKTATKRK